MRDDAGGGDVSLQHARFNRRGVMNPTATGKGDDGGFALTCCQGGIGVIFVAISIVRNICRCIGDGLITLNGAGVGGRGRGRGGGR